MSKWLHKYRLRTYVYLPRQSQVWLEMFTEEEFNRILLNNIPLNVVINSPKLTIEDSLELLMKHQGYRISSKIVEKKSTQENNMTINKETYEFYKGRVHRRIT